MPEIVEVYRDAEDLNFFLSNRSMLEAKFETNLFNNKCPGIEELNKSLPLPVKKVLSRAKKIFIHLQKDQTNWWIIIAHGMSGRISSKKYQHSHISFTMSPSWIGMNKWYIENTRRIGYCQASNDPEFFQFHVQDMAKPICLGWKEEFFEIISFEEFETNIKNKGKHKYLASALMDQRTICSGIGNWILSEVFHEAGFDTEIRCDELSEENILKLYRAIYKVIKQGYTNGGVSMSDYYRIDGTAGSHQNFLQVYGKAGEQINGKFINAKKGPHGRTIYYIETTKND